MIKRIIISGLLCLFLISAVGCGGGTLTEPVVSEKTTSSDEVLGEEIEVTVPDSEQGALIITSAFEAIKAFYLAANKRDYSDAQKYLFPDFLSLFEEPQISQVGGIEKILDLFTANGAVKEVTLYSEDLFLSSASGRYLSEEDLDLWSPEIVQATQQKNVEVWEVRYTIEFMPPLGERWEDAYVVKEADTYKISTGWGYSALSKGWGYSGLASSIMAAADSVLWDFEVYDISSQPGREGYTEYEFLIGMKHGMKELASRMERWVGEGCTKAIWDQYEYEGSIFYLPWESTNLHDIYNIEEEMWYGGLHTEQVEYWPPEYTYMTKSWISVPTNITSPTFYLITPDLRYFKINLDGPWPKIPTSPSLEWFGLGQTLEVKDYWSITPLALKKFNDGERFILPIRLENLSGYDQTPEESIYFLQIRPVIEEFSSELSKLDAIPAFCGREFGIEIPSEAGLIELIERGWYQKWEVLSPIEGAIADLLVVVKDQETKKPISYQIYRLE